MLLNLFSKLTTYFFIISPFVCKANNSVNLSDPTPKIQKVYLINNEKKYFRNDSTINGLVAHYPFYGNSNDVIGGNNAKVVGATLTTDRFGKPESAYYFNGTPSNYLNLGSSSVLKPTNGTISLWASIEDFSTTGAGFSYNPIILVKNGNQNNFFEAYCIYITDNEKFISIVTSPNPVNEKYIYSNANYVKNKWSHVAITFTKDSLKLFIDGKLDKKVFKGFSTEYSSTDSVMLGNSADVQNNRYYKGKIDDVRVYNRALGDSEILSLYNSEKGYNSLTDLALKSFSQNRVVEKDKEGIISFTLKNEGTVKATNIKVLLKIPYSPPFVQKNSQNCTKGTFDSNMWTIPELAAGDSCILNITYQPIQNGVWYVEAEVFSADQEDSDSKVNNGIDTEDDFARACLSIPIKIEAEPFGMQLIAEDSKMDILQWYKNDTIIAGATSGVLQVTSLGRFSYTTKTFKCPTQGCCPFILEKAIQPINCCVPLEYILKK
ncbi:MAG: hypothetical protein MUF45_07790 [Spirosomaceae bacterium]|jgi:hypothetical protein|nr:hypothetical protein [Spirosomataceae bacterium]